ncbi:MAG: dihydroorotase [Bacteroidia bacterium]
MKVLFKKATICDPASPEHGKRLDVLIEDGMIIQLGDELLANGAQEITSDNLCLSPGWLDMQAHLRDPGEEQKETLESAAAAAAAGGFTSVLAMPDTHPCIQTKADVDYVLRRSAHLAVEIIPAGALTVGLEGKEMAESYDMHLAGAKAFTDGLKPIAHAGVLVRSLLYTKNFGAPVLTHADERSISADGKMHEGPTSTMLGLKGIPSLAEDLMTSRNIELAEYADAPIHLLAVSSAKSVALIREAKKRGLHVTASVNAAHLFFNDTALEGFDSNFKLSPPIRSEEDRLALIDGLVDKTIDAISSGHAPEDAESKVVEFDIAASGMIGLETAFALARTASPSLPLPVVLNAFCNAPRKILGIGIPKIAVGEKANITAFDPDTHWTFAEKDIRSKSKNTPLVGTPLTGKVLGIYARGAWVMA